MKIALLLFGAPRVQRDGQNVDFDTRKAVALLAYLALTGGKQRRDTLATLFYPESDQVTARSALRRTLSSVRKVVGEDCFISGRELISLDLDCVWVDVLTFRRELSISSQHGHSNLTTCLECFTRLTEAVKLSSEPFMAGFTLRDSPGFDDWQFFQSETLRQELSGLLEKVTRVYTHHQDYEQAIYQCRRWLALDELNEEAHRQLMLLYAWNHQRGAALRQYRECVRILEHELGVSPLDETTDIYQAILENRVPDFPNTYPSSEERPPIIEEKSPVRLDQSLQRVPFIGRSKEMQIILEAHHLANPGGYSLIIEGEAGIGKTRLVEEFLIHAKSNGVQVIRGRCYEGETNLSYAPFAESLAATLRKPEARSKLERLSRNILSTTMHLVPEMATHFPSLPVEPPGNFPAAQVRLFDAVKQVLEVVLGGNPPGILFIDDLHWADLSSLDLLAFLMRRISGVLILGTFRSEEIPRDHVLRQMITPGSGERRTEILTLPRLSVEDLTEILNSTYLKGELPDDVILKLIIESEGNPFFLLEYIDSLSSKEDLSLTGAWTIPSGVRDLFRSRMATAGELGEQLLGAGAVIGRSFDLNLLREVSGRSELETVNGIDKLIGQHLITEEPSIEQPGGEIYNFTHDKLRTLMYEELSRARRRMLHQRTAETLINRYRDRNDVETIASLIAYHYRLAGQFNLAADYFKLAGEYASRLYANRDAIEHFKNALACDHSEAASIHESLGDLYLLSGEFKLALANYEAASALTSPDHLPVLERKLGELYSQRGEWDLAEGYFREALELSKEVESFPEKSRIYAAWSWASHRRGLNDQALELANYSMQKAMESQDSLASARAHNILGVIMRSRGNHEEAKRHLEQSLKIAIELDDPGVRSAASNNLARTYVDIGDYDHAIYLTESALNYSVQIGDLHRTAALHNNLADLLHHTQRTKEAMDHLIKAVVLFSEIGEQSDELVPEIWMLVEW